MRIWRTRPIRHARTRNGRSRSSAGARSACRRAVNIRASSIVSDVVGAAGIDITGTGTRPGGSDLLAEAPTRHDSAICVSARGKPRNPTQPAQRAGACGRQRSWCARAIHQGRQACARVDAAFPAADPVVSAGRWFSGRSSARRHCPSPFRAPDEGPASHPLRSAQRGRPRSPPTLRARRSQGACRGRS